MPQLRLHKNARQPSCSRTAALVSQSRNPVPQKIKNVQRITQRESHNHNRLRARVPPLNPHEMKPTPKSDTSRAINRATKAPESSPPQKSVPGRTTKSQGQEKTLEYADSNTHNVRTRESQKHAVIANNVHSDAKIFLGDCANGLRSKSNESRTRVSNRYHQRMFRASTLVVRPSKAHE